MRYVDTGTLYCGDNLKRLRRFPDECVDLVYLDPPFFSNRNYEVIWGDEAEVRSFEDRWEGGMNHYSGWMRDRIIEMHRVLKPNGSIYLHCDPHASHHLKVMMDDVFGMGKFRNEIVWKRTSGHSDSSRYGSVHDSILYYAKGENPTWNKIYQAYDEAYVRQYYRYQDHDGRRWMSGDLSAAGLSGGGYDYEWKGITRTWRVPESTMERLEQENRIYYTRNRIPRLKRYLDESQGLPVQDVWSDVEALRSWHQERLGYPTQKPEALLKRIIDASSNPGDVVLDPFCGCGTTVAVAQLSGRDWIGIDISPTAVEIMNARLEKLGATGIETVGVPRTEAELRKLKPFEFQNWIIRRVDGTHSPKKTGDMGIDGFSFLERAPIQVKRSDRVGRNVVDNFETAVERYGVNRGYVVAFSFTRGAREEAARARNAKGLEIDLVTVEELLLGTSELVAPVLNREVLELPSARPKDARPTAERLVESDQVSEEVA